MILRTWRGRTTLQNAAAYQKFLTERAGQDYSSVDGFKTLYFTRRDEGGEAHFLLITVWDSMAAVKRFAGDAPEKAKYYPEDDDYLLEKEPSSFNHTVFFEKQGFEDV